jgi:hypothetical protein
VSNTPRTDAAYAASIGAGIYELFKVSQDIERELNAANERIKRLEDAGDEMERWCSDYQTAFNWEKAKEAKP